MANPSLSYLYGKPEFTADLRTEMADFKVFERLPFEPSGEGEHLLLHIRKTGCNTVFVARQLAKFFGVKERDVTYAGLKDRFAVTEQWFGVHLPGKHDIDTAGFSEDGVEILECTRHNKKLKTGALLGNTFKLTLRNVNDVLGLARKWQMVAAFGVPNYFGEQRFGIDGGNIEAAKAMFNGKKVRDKKKRSIYLSAARSFLFNSVVSKRVDDKSFEQPHAGDVMMLAGSQSIFKPETIDEEIIQRFQEKDIDMTAPMWGRGALKTDENIGQLEANLKKEFAELCNGLEENGLKQERRRIRLNLTEADIEYSEQDKIVTLSFFLSSGCFATTILRELVDYRDLTQRNKE
mgnify:CR=1 FL=1